LRVCVCVHVCALPWCLHAKGVLALIQAF
jgi:hypothetical protein